MTEDVYILEIDKYFGDSEFAVCSLLTVMHDFESDKEEETERMF